MELFELARLVLVDSVWRFQTGSGISDAREIGLAKGNGDERKKGG
jgi:hypothetical protein